MTENLQLELADEYATLQFGGRVAHACRAGVVLYLHGDLGAGKSTFARGFLAALGVREHIKSPTFTIVEPYTVGARNAYHLDLYRVADPQELELLGIRDYFASGVYVLIEWPERGQGVLPQADLHLDLTYFGSGRRASLRPTSDVGRRIVDALRGDAFANS